MAAGDLVYETTTGTHEITQALAVQAAQWAITNGLWNGAASDMLMLSITVSRNPDGSAKYYAEVAGKKSAAPADLPIGSRVIGRL
jgi:hypothetical protein